MGLVLMLRRSAWVLLLAISIAFATHKSPLNPSPSAFRTYRAVPEYTELKVRAYGNEALAFDVVNRVGGVLFQGKATWLGSPGWWGRIKRFFCDERIDYDAVAPNGRRYTLDFECKSTTLPYTDEFFAPVIEFVASDFTGAVTLLGANNHPTPEEVARQAELGAKFIVQFHPAFKDTLVGNMLLLADAAFVDPEVLDVAQSWREPLQAMWPDVPASPPESLEPALEQVANNGTSECPTYASYIIVDVDTQYTLDISDGVLNIDGLPYYSFWCEYPEEGSAYHYYQLQVSDLVPTAPYVYETVLRAGRAAAFLRWFRDEATSAKGLDFIRKMWRDSNSWSNLVDATQNLTIEGYETPGFWNPTNPFLEYLQQLIKQMESDNARQ